MSTDNMWKYDFLHKSNGLQKQKQSLKCIYEHYITVGLFILEDVSSSKRERGRKTGMQNTLRRKNDVNVIRRKPKSEALMLLFFYFGWLLPQTHIPHIFSGTLYTQ